MLFRARSDRGQNQQNKQSDKGRRYETHMFLSVLRGRLYHTIMVITCDPKVVIVANRRLTYLLFPAT